MIGICFPQYNKHIIQHSSIAQKTLWKTWKPTNVQVCKTIIRILCIIRIFKICNKKHWVQTNIKHIFLFILFFERLDYSDCQNSSQQCQKACHHSRLPALLSLITAHFRIQEYNRFEFSKRCEFIKLLITHTYDY